MCEQLRYNVLSLSSSSLSLSLSFSFSQRVKFTSSARNPPGPPPQAQVTPSQPDVAPDAHSTLLTTLAQATTQQQKQIIGEHLYREIYSMHADLAGKITGRERKREREKYLLTDTEYMREMSSCRTDTDTIEKPLYKGHI